MRRIFAEQVLLDVLLLRGKVHRTPVGFLVEMAANPVKKLLAMNVVVPAHGRPIASSRNRTNCHRSSSLTCRLSDIVGGRYRRRKCRIARADHARSFRLREGRPNTLDQRDVDSKCPLATGVWQPVSVAGLTEGRKKHSREPQIRPATGSSRADIDRRAGFVGPNELVQFISACGPSWLQIT